MEVGNWEMAEAKRENIEHMNHQIDVYPRDLLRRFGGGGCPGEASLAVKEEFVEEVELSLGLSLGGSFGSDPNKTGIIRSSSVAAFSFFPRKEEEGEEEVEEGKGTLMGTATAQLMRTCSLPVETCEEHRKRKEMQSLRRLENKRKREEKRGNRPKVEEIIGSDRGRGMVNIPRPASLESMDAGVSSSSPSPSVTRRRRQDNHNYIRGPATISGRLVRQQSCGAQGGCATSSSEYGCRSMQGLNISGLNSGNTESKCSSPSSIKAIAECTDKKTSLVCSVLVKENPTHEENTGLSKKAVVGGNGGKEVGRSMMEDMPHVSTQGDGPNGQRVEGLLYKYSKGEEVRIMCVCHGKFLSPAEFVKHAGGGDVEFPLRHIVVYPS